MMNGTHKLPMAHNMPPSIAKGSKAYNPDIIHCKTPMHQTPKERHSVKNIPSFTSTLFTNR